MTEFTFPDIIQQLPEADIPLEGKRGWLTLENDHQFVFMEIEPVGKVAGHSHGDQWGASGKGQG